MGVAIDMVIETYQLEIDNRNMSAIDMVAFGWQLRKLKMELDRTDPLQDILFKRKESVGHTYLVNWAKLETYLKAHGAMYEGWHAVEEDAGK